MARRVVGTVAAAAVLVALAPGSAEAASGRAPRVYGMSGQFDVYAGTGYRQLLEKYVNDDFTDRVYLYGDPDGGTGSYRQRGTALSMTITDGPLAGCRFHGSYGPNPRGSHARPTPTFSGEMVCPDRPTTYWVMVTFSPD